MTRQQESDAEVRAKIVERFGDVLNRFAGNMYVDDSLFAMGRPPAEWHAEAFARIDELQATGMTVNGACRKVAEDAVPRHGSSDNMIMIYRRHQREAPLEQFRDAVICGDLDRAVRGYRDLTLCSKRKLGLE